MCTFFSTAPSARLKTACWLSDCPSQEVPTVMPPQSTVPVIEPGLQAEFAELELLELLEEDELEGVDEDEEELFEDEEEEGVLEELLAAPAIEHSLTPPAILLPKVAALQTKLPDRTL
jgi:hypothetical protein